MNIQKLSYGKTLLTERVASFLQNDQSRMGFICEGGGNLGDEIMLEAAQKLFTRAKLFRWTSSFEHLLNGIGLSGQHYFNSVILGGGTLINPNGKRIKTIHRALQQGLVFWSLGTGVGSAGYGQRKVVEIKDWKPILADFKGIGVRGPISKNYLESLDIGNVEVIGDLALSFARNQLVKSSVIPRFAVNIRLPIINTIKPHSLREYAELQEIQEKLQELEEALRKLIKNGWQPVPIAMHISDVQPLRHLMQSISMEHLPIPLVSSADEFFQRVGSCSFTIGVRLHSSVLSCCAGVPPLMLGYRDKCLDFMQSMELEEWYIDLYTAKPGEIADKALLLSEKAQNLRPIILSKAQSWKSTIEEYVANTRESLN